MAGPVFTHSSRSGKGVIFPSSALRPQRHREKAVAAFLPVRELTGPNLLTSCVALANWLVSLDFSVSVSSVR